MTRLSNFAALRNCRRSGIEGSDSRYILGTDAVGRDMLSRLIYGARVSLFIGVSVMVVSTFVGAALGLAAAWFGGIVDVVILRTMDLIMSIPSLVLAILIIAVIGPKLDQHHRRGCGGRRAVTS